MLYEDIELKDPAHIEQAKKTHVSTIEPLYWVLEDSLSSGNKSRAEWIFVGFLYLAKYRKDLIAKGLQPDYIERLKQIAYEIYEDKAFKKQEPVAIKYGTHSRRLPFADEKELEEYLCDNSSLLADALNDEIEIIGNQVETEFGYKCDIVARSKKMFYPIELKIAQADHRAVSQCNKYCWYFYRQLRYNRYRKIQGVVCAAGFDNWSINELRREGIWIFDMVPNNKDIHLRRIE